jgi:hypothetical protein
MRQAQLDVAAAQAGQELGFQILDAPQLPTTPTRQVKKILIYPAAALAGGLLLSALLLLLFALGDRSVRSMAELSPQAAAIGVMPRLTAKGMARSGGPAIVRKGISFVAGSAVTVDTGARLKV